MIVGLLFMSTLVVGVAVAEDACACAEILSTILQRVARIESTVNLIAKHEDIETRVDVLMQQRVEHTSSFFSRTWAEYVAGFGDETGNYWIGLERLHELTSTGLYKLRVDVQAQSNGEWYWEEFPGFKVGDETTGFELSIDAVNCNGTAGKSYIGSANGMKFSTIDVDNDVDSNRHCAADSDIANGGGGWYKDCGGFYLNALTGPDSGWYGFTWHTVPGYRLLQSRLTLVPLE
jgi:hypothetical protein